MSDPERDRDGPPVTRYVIYGAGAVGGVLGGRLFAAGHDVVLIARGAHHDAIAADGLRMETPGGPLQLLIPVVSSPSHISFREGDTVILAMKGQDTGAAVQALRASAPADVAVLCTQNGVENERVALRSFANVYGVRVSIPASHLEPGVVLAHGTPMSGIVDIGRYPLGRDAITEQFVGDARSATFDTRSFDTIMRWKYCKLLGNLGNAVEAVCEPGAHVRSGSVTARARQEGVACFRAAGIDFASEAEDRERRGTSVALAVVGGQGHVGASSWQSLQRRSGGIETDFLNGEIVLLGRQYGVPTPINAVLAQIANDLARRGTGPGALSETDVLNAAGV